MRPLLAHSRIVTLAVLLLLPAVTRQVPREDPRARRAMTENGF
jgi:hypothetical protein